MKTKKENNGIIGGLFWKFLERFCAQFVSFGISILLARLLLPKDYGVVALVLVFIDIANIFVSNGFSTALIQKKEADDLDFSTMFYCSIFISIIIYILLFFTAPMIAKFYDNDLLVIVIRVLALKLPLSAINSIQHAFVSKHMLFKKFFFSTLLGTIISGVIGILMAYKGFGVMALVFQYLINSFIDMVVLFFTIEWKPKLIFSMKNAKVLMKYGWKITIGAFFDELYTQIRSLIIGKKYDSAALAYYNKGTQFPKLIISNINSSISSVLFPALSNCNDDISKVKYICQTFIKIVSYIVTPILVYLFIVSPTLIEFLLTRNWLPCVPFLRIACVMYIFTPINTANLQAIKAIGRSDIFLKTEILKKVIGIIILLISMNFGIYVLAFSTIIVQLICNVINIYPNSKLLDYSFKEQFSDIIPAIFASCFMGAIIYFIPLLGLHNIALLIVQFAIGLIIYLLISILFKMKAYVMLIKLFKEKIFLRRKSE